MSEWRAIPGWEGHYEVSSEGQVKSIARISVRGHKVPERILHPTARGAGYLHVGLKRDTNRIRALMTVHKAVMLAFVGPRPDGNDIRHLDGDPSNNTLANLAYGTRTENNLDAVRHGTNLNAAKTHCNQGHEFTPENTYLFRTSRICRTCARARRARHQEQRRNV